MKLYQKKTELLDLKHLYWALKIYKSLVVQLQPKICQPLGAVCFPQKNGAIPLNTNFNNKRSKIACLNFTYLMLSAK